MKGIIFDMDDTLVNSASAHMAAVRDSLKEFNLPMKWEEIRSRFGKKITNIIREVYGINDGQLLKKIEIEKKKNFKKYINLVKLMPGAKEILEYTNKNFKTALASMSLRENIELILRHLKIEGYFDVIVSGDALPTRPSPAILLVACRKMRLKPNECISIGDSVYGIESAHRIGMNFIGVATGIFDETDLKNSGADFVVRDLFEALDILREIKRVQTLEIARQ